MDDNRMFNALFRKKPTMMLIKLYQEKGELYASFLAKTVDCTYSHVVKILKQMEKANLVRFDKQGRIKLLTLTKKGQEVASHLEAARLKLLEK